MNLLKAAAASGKRARGSGGAEDVVFPEKFYDSSFLSSWNSGSPPTTYVEGPPWGFSGNFPFVRSGILAADGRVIYFGNPDKVAEIYDPVTDNHTTQTTNHTPNGIIEMVYYTEFGNAIISFRNSDDIFRYDIMTDTYTNIISPSGQRPGVISLTGEIILFTIFWPGKLVHYNPATDTSKTVTISKRVYVAGVLAPSGDIIIVNTNSDIDTYNPVTETFTSAVTTHPEGNDAFNGGLVLPTGKILLLPDQSSYIGLFDPATNTYTRGPLLTGFIGTGRFTDAVLTPSGSVIMISEEHGETVGLYDPFTDTYSEFSIATSTGSGQISQGPFRGCVLTLSGDVVLLPRTSPNVGILTGGTPIPNGTNYAPTGVFVNNTFKNQ